MELTNLCEKRDEILFQARAYQYLKCEQLIQKFSRGVMDNAKEWNEQLNSLKRLEKYAEDEQQQTELMFVREYMEFLYQTAFII